MKRPRPIPRSGCLITAIKFWFITAILIPGAIAALYVFGMWRKFS